MIIGICGKSGSGKSSFALEIQKIHQNAYHLDIDKIGHEVLFLENVKKQLKNTFGDIFDLKGEVNRKKLGAIVFSDEKQMESLTNITWPAMEILIEEKIFENEIIILDWQLLVKTKFFSMCDIKIYLDIDYDIRKQRILKRDGISEEDFFLRDSASLNIDKNMFDYIYRKSDIKKIKEVIK